MSKYPVEHPVLRHPQTKFHIHTNIQAKFLYICGRQTSRRKGSEPNGGKHYQNSTCSWFPRESNFDLLLSSPHVWAMFLEVSTYIIKYIRESRCRKFYQNLFIFSEDPGPWRRKHEAGFLTAQLSSSVHRHTSSIVVVHAVTWTIIPRDFNHIILTIYGRRELVLARDRHYIRLVAASHKSHTYSISSVNIYPNDISILTCVPCEVECFKLFCLWNKICFLSFQLTSLAHVRSNLLKLSSSALLCINSWECNSFVIAAK
jgi:hypothetical protein